MTDITDETLRQWERQASLCVDSFPACGMPLQWLRRFAELANEYQLSRADLTIASPEMAGEMAELKRRIKDEPGFGASLLREAGIINERGELAERFGGARGSDK